MGSTRLISGPQWPVSYLLIFCLILWPSHLRRGIYKGQKEDTYNRKARLSNNNRVKTKKKLSKLLLLLKIGHLSVKLNLLFFFFRFFENVKLNLLGI